MSIRYPDLELCDIHLHIMDPYSLIPEQDFQMPTCENAHVVIDIMEQCGLQKVNIPAISLYDPADLVCNPLALYAKTLSEGRVFALAGLRRSCDAAENIHIDKQAEDLIQAGFDGFKLICKPNVRRKFKFAINDPMFDDFYALVQEKQYPVLFHIGDPASFWKEQEAPQWAVNNGWYYGNEKEIPSLEELYIEIMDVLKRYPHLKITFAHFLFMSSDFKIVSRLFDQFDNVRFDVTPGTEMYFDFANKRKETKEFFTRYSGRILFGTDNVGVNGTLTESNLNQSKNKIAVMRTFFETEEKVSMDGRNVRGIGLSKEVCKKLYNDSFYSFLGKDIPSAVNIERALKLCQVYKEALPEHCNYYKETIGLLNELESKFKEANG